MSSVLLSAERLPGAGKSNEEGAGEGVVGLGKI
jgi:hypothetical protein